MTRVCVFLLLGLCITCDGYGKRQHTDEQYTTIVKLVQGTFDTPVKDRTDGQKAAIVKFYRGEYLALD